MPERLVSQLAHVEIVTPDLDKVMPFYTDVLCLEVSGREGDSVYLRGWGDFFHHTLQLTTGDGPALGHIAWRAEGPEQLETAVARIEATGRGEGWYDGSTGHGPAYRYRAPGGHLHEIFWEVERFKPSPEQVSPFPNRAQRYVPRGAGVRCIDHVTIATADPEGDINWYRDTLNHRYMEYTVIPDRPDFVVFGLLTYCERSHDLGVVWDASPVPARINHVAYFVETRSDLLRVADVLLNQDVAIEFGPGKHGMGEQDYLYIRDPAGFRIEINAGGYRIYEPDWEVVRFEPQQGSNVFYKNLAMPTSMFESFPSVEFTPQAADDAKAATGLFN